MAVDGVINEREYRVIALRRSGHHAVINWLLKQLHGRGCFLNNCLPGTNPYVSCAKFDSRLEQVDIHAESTGRWSPKNYLIYNYEDHPLPAVAGKAFDEVCLRSLGDSQHRFRLLVLRDPYNLIASKLRWAQGRQFPPSRQSLTQLPELWKSYAREFLGQTKLLGDCIRVNYNQWVENDAYRRELATQLGIEFTDDGIDEVAKWGPATWGDSFDGLTFDGRARQMKVMERWKAFANDPFYRSLVADAELCGLSDEIFGELQIARMAASMFVDDPNNSS